MVRLLAFLFLAATCSAQMPWPVQRADLGTTTNGTGCVLHMTMDRISGTTVYDQSGSGNNGTVTNFTDMAQGQIGNALSVPGAITNIVTDVGTLSTFSFVQNTRVFTVTAWVILEAAGSRDWFVGNIASSTDKGFSVIHENFTGDAGWGYVAYTNVLRVFASRGVFASPSFDIVSSNNELTADGLWKHIAVVGNGSKIACYVNGQSKAVRGFYSANSSGNSTRALAIGATQYTSLLLPLKGKLDDLRIYNRALSPAEIAAMYASQLQGHQ